MLLVLPAARFDGLVQAGGTTRILITLDGVAAAILRNEAVALPNLRRLAEVGFVANSGMKVSNPTTTWTNHTSLVTGVNADRHSVLFNGKLRLAADGTPLRVDATASKAELVLAPTIYDLAHAAGMATAAIHWPGCRGATTLDDNWPDTPTPMAFITPRLRNELVDARIIPSAEFESLSRMSGAARDAIRVAAAIHLIKTRPPRLLLLHLTNTDGIQHEYGPDTAASATACAWADSLVGQVISAVHDAGLEESTTIIVTADHGFTAPLKTLAPNAILREAGLLQIDHNGKILQARVQVRGDGGTAFVYFSGARPAAEEIKRVADLFRNRAELADVITPERFAEFGYPEAEKNSDIGSLVLVARDGFAFGNDAVGDQFVIARGASANVGAHGWLNSQSKMHALFLAVGPFVRPQTAVMEIQIVDVAPTIAALLGLDLPTSVGRPIAELCPPLAAR